jgi:hypothetical protein
MTTMKGRNAVVEINRVCKEVVGLPIYETLKSKAVLTVTNKCAPY